MNSIISLIAVAVIPTVTAWSGFSHKIVARIATNPHLLSAKALAYILEHFPETTSRLAEDALVPIADWADTIASSDPYHFTYTPYRNCQPFVAARDCGQGATQGLCLSTGIELYFNRAADISLSRQERKEAIMFLVHFVADASQPLHTGFREDAGGNGIDLTEPTNMTLHQLWDHGLLDAYRASKRGITWEAIADSLVSKADSKVDAFSLNDDVVASNAFADVMITDTVMSTTCNLAYKTGNATVNAWIEDGGVADSMYILTRQATVLSQLQKAGIRLAQVLNWLAQIHGRRVHEARRARSELHRSYATTSTCIPVGGELRLVAGDEGSNSARTTGLPEDDDDLSFKAGDGYFAPLFSRRVHLDEFSSCTAGAGDSVSIAPCPARPAKPDVMYGPGDNEKAYLERTLAGRERYAIMGVQLDELVLMTRNNLRFMTFRSLAADPKYTPHTSRYHTLPDGPEDGFQGIYLDNRVFGGFDKIPATVVKAALVFIKEGRMIEPSEYVEGEAGNDTPLDITHASEEMRMAARVVAAALGPRPPIVGPSDDKVLLRSESKLVLLALKNQWFVSRSDFVKPDPSVTRITFSAIELAISTSPVKIVMLLIDSRLYDAAEGSIEMGTLIMRMSRFRAKRKFSEDAMADNPKLALALLQFAASPLAGLSVPIGDGVSSALLASVRVPRPDKPLVTTFELILNPDFVFDRRAHTAYLKKQTAH